MKMKKNSAFFLLPICLFACALLFSCISTSLPKPPSIDLDYTQKDVHDAEVKRIYGLLQKNPVEALWRAVILGDKDLSDECAGYVKDALTSHIEQKDCVESWTFYNSLLAAGYDEYASKVMDKASMKKMMDLFFRCIDRYLP